VIVSLPELWIPQESPSCVYCSAYSPKNRLPSLLSKTLQGEAFQAPFTDVHRAAAMSGPKSISPGKHLGCKC
jgi:hypothetical protein